MPEVGEFEFIDWVIPEQKIGRWAGTFASEPDDDWRVLFEQEVAFERATVGGFAGIRRLIGGTYIEFDSPDYMAQMAATVIRRVAQRTDTTWERYRRQQASQEQVRKQQQDRLTAQLNASEEKLRKL